MAELVMVLILIGILLLMARPALASLLDRAAVISATSELVALIGAARHLAITEGRLVAVRLETTGRATVRSGAVVFQHRDLRATHGVSLTATRDSVAFHPTGRGYGAANTRVVLSRGRAADTIFVSRLGRVRH